MGLAPRRADRRRGRNEPAGSIETTVTYLAMAAPPRDLPPMPTSPPLALMKAEKIPLHFYRYLYGTVGGSWLWVERLQLDDEALAAEDPPRRRSRSSSSMRNGSPAGYYELDFSEPGAHEPRLFRPDAGMDRPRIGPWLLGSAISAGVFPRRRRKSPSTPARSTIPAALPLYQRLGFQPVRREERQLAVPPNVAVPGHIAARLLP